jgi:hypothetical protein
VVLCVRVVDGAKRSEIDSVDRVEGGIPLGCGPTRHDDASLAVSISEREGCVFFIPLAR